MKTWMKMLTVAASVALLAGCSGKPSAPATVNLTIGNTVYETREITMEKGKAYQLVIENKDVQLHDFSIDKIDVKSEHAGDSHDMGHDMGGKKPDLHVAIDAGKTATLTFTPNQQGTFTFYCTTPGHKDAGMSGKLIVK